MKIKFNPFTGTFDWVEDLSGYVPYAGATSDVNLGVYNLTTTGTGTFGGGVYLGNASTRIYKDESGNITFIDVVTGSKTLAELVSPEVTLTKIELPEDGVKVEVESDKITFDVDSAEVAQMTDVLFDLKLPLKMNNNKITNLATPTEDTDAATKAYADALSVGLTWQDSVLDFSTQAAATQTTGNRYIASEDGADWTENNIYEWSGSEWVETEAVNLMAVSVEGDGRYYSYNDTDEEWKDIGTLFTHNSLTGLQGGSSPNEYYHLTEAQRDNIYIKNVDDTGSIIEGSKLFFTNARVDSRVQGQDYTITGDWEFNNNIVQANAPILGSHLTNKDYVESVLDGISWQLPVKSRTETSPPESPDIGDRYIVSGTSDNWYNNSWSHRQKVTVDSSKVTSTQSGFRMLISISDVSNGLFSRCQSNGNDILFTSSDGTTKIPHEITYINTTTGVLEAWVKSDVSSVADTEIYMYYGNPTSGSQQDVANTWDGYHLVQHMGDTGAVFTDKSPAGNNGTPQSVSQGITGKVGNAASFSGTSPSSIDLGSSNNLTGNNLQTLTMQVWVKFTTSSSGYIWAIKRSAAESTLISLQANSTAGALGLLGYPTSGAHVGLYDVDGYNDGNWHKLDAVIDGANRYVYIDGSLKASDTRGLASVTGNTATSVIGGFRDVQLLLACQVDEVRFSRSARSADWLATEYNNQNSPSTFYSLGTEETPSAAGDWAGEENNITTWDGVNWAFAEPSTGWTTFVEDEELQYNWNGTAWIPISSVSEHNSLSGIQGGGLDEYYHLEAAQHTNLTPWVDAVTLGSDGAMNLSAGAITTTGAVSSGNVTSSGLVRSAYNIATGSGSWPSVANGYVANYMLGTTGRIFCYTGSAYKDLAIGDWNGGDPNIMLKVGGNVGIGLGSPEERIHVDGNIKANDNLIGDGLELFDSNSFTVTQDGTDTVVDVDGGALKLTSSFQQEADSEHVLTAGVFTFYAGHYDVINQTEDLFTDSNDEFIIDMGMNVTKNKLGTVDNYGEDCVEANIAHRFFASSSCTFAKENETINSYNGGILGAIGVDTDINASGGVLNSRSIAFYSDVFFQGGETLGTHNAENFLITGVLETEGHGVSVGTVLNAFLYADTDTFIVEATDETHFILDSSSYPWTKRADNAKITLGAGDDTEMYWDGTDFILDPTEGSGGVKIPVGEDLHIKTELLTLDLTSLVSDLYLYVPVLESTAKDSLDIFGLEYGLGVKNRLLIVDDEESGFSELIFTQPGFLSDGAVGNILFNFTDEIFEVGGGDFCPNADDYGDDIFYDIGQDGLEWNNAKFKGEVKANTIKIGDTELTESDLIALLALL